LNRVEFVHLITRSYTAIDAIKQISETGTYLSLSTNKDRL